MNIKIQQIVLMLTISFFFIGFTGYPVAAQWTITTVDSTVNAGVDTSLALDGSGNPRISYHRVDTDDLKYAWCDVNCANTGNWAAEAVDSAGDVGEYTSLALDAGGNPRISYYAFETGALKYAFCDTGCDNPSNWANLAVDSSSKMDGDTSLVLDGSGNPRISYHDDVDSNLKYTWCDTACDNTGNWNSIAVDSAGDVGLYSSLVLDSSGNPRVSYYKSDTGDLKYAWCDAGCDNPVNWNNITVASDGNVGLYTSLALDSGNNPRISYQDGTSLDLYYTWCNAGCADPANWNRVAVDTLGPVGADLSLALDSSGNPRISYSGNDTLKYAWCDTGCNDPGNWNTETVDSTAGTVGAYTSLKLDGSDISHISYYDLTNGNLKYAYNDIDNDGISNTEDNCPEDFNPLQEDTYPPGGNGIGDACDCEADFDCDGDVDADDVEAFLVDFGRAALNNPCATGNPCNGDFACDTDVDADDVEKFLEDFGRAPLNNPCPACVAGDWCSY
jgi:hypothetical protein